MNIRTLLLCATFSSKSEISFKSSTSVGKGSNVRALRFANIVMVRATRQFEHAALAEEAPRLREQQL